MAKGSTWGGKEMKSAGWEVKGRVEANLSARRRNKTNIARRVFLIALIAGGLLTSGGEIAWNARAEVPAQQFELLEATVPQLQAALTAGTVTSRDLVRSYLARIDAFDQRGPALNAISVKNDNALA